MNGDKLIADSKNSISVLQQELNKIKVQQASRRAEIAAELAQLDSQINPLQDTIASAVKQLQETKRKMLGPWIAYEERDGQKISGQRLLFGSTKADCWNSKVWLRRVGHDRADWHKTCTPDYEWIWTVTIDGCSERDHNMCIEFGRGTGDLAADFARLSKIVDTHLEELGWILCD
jgi:septal ring factor EnvC (AmiA/AmiB activator)